MNNDIQTETKSEEPRCIDIEEEDETEIEENSSSKLLLSFVLLTIFGTGNSVFNKLQMIPMYNYPNFLNLATTFMYVPLSALYVWPVYKYNLLNNTITSEHLNMSKKPFAIMGLLDCCSSSLFTFASVYLPGSLLVLLPQAAIPVSMALTKLILRQHYTRMQIFGAFIVVIGLLTVLLPLVETDTSTYECVAAFDLEQNCAICEVAHTKDECLAHFDVIDNEEKSVCQWTNDTTLASDNIHVKLVWSIVVILACVPMTLSSIYKEITIGQRHLDPVFLNGWVAFFQFFYSLIVAVPGGLVSQPQVHPSELPKNIWDGFKCYMGKGTIWDGCHPDSHCADEAMIFVNISFLFSIGYNILMILILKFGSANILYLSSTIMVPLGNVIFALPFMPERTVMHSTDLLGLIMILMGLCVYRFGKKLLFVSSLGRLSTKVRRLSLEWEENHDDNDTATSLTESLLPIQDDF